MTPCILVTEKEYRKGERIFEAADGLEIRPAPADEEALAAEVWRRRASAVVVGVEPYSGTLYTALSETAGDGANALIARFGVGCDGIDLERARADGILVANTPGVLDQSVAEHALWLMGALARHVSAGDAAVRCGEFSAGTGMELAGRTLGIIGFGAIGRRLARMAYLGLGMRVLAADRLSLEALAARDGSDPETIREATGVAAVAGDAAAVIGEADVISIHLPALPATEHFVDAALLGRFKPGALLVNTARGSLVDEIALYDALSGGGIAGAALDVFEDEPYCPRGPAKDLCTLPNIVLTPHIGSSTIEANRRMAQACVANVSAFVAGRVEDLTAVS